MSIGEDRVRTKFNPSVSSTVDQLKQKSAELIDLCEELKKLPARENFPTDEFNRLMALAQTHYEEATMWAVKAMTL